MIKNIKYWYLIYLQSVLYLFVFGRELLENEREHIFQTLPFITHEERRWSKSDTFPRETSAVFSHGNSLGCFSLAGKVPGKCPEQRLRTFAETLRKMSGSIMCLQLRSGV